MKIQIKIHASAKEAAEILGRQPKKSAPTKRTEESKTRPRRQKNGIIGKQGSRMYLRIIGSVGSLKNGSREDILTIGNSTRNKIIHTEEQVKAHTPSGAFENGFLAQLSIPSRSDDLTTVQYSKVISVNWQPPLIMRLYNHLSGSHGVWSESIDPNLDLIFLQVTAASWAKCRCNSSRTLIFATWLTLILLTAPSQIVTILLCLPGQQDP